jgi:hypothetical protein
MNRRNTRRPYWLLLALALFVAGQIASAGHWHDDSKTLDADCALCMLSGANSGAAIHSAWPLVAVALFAFVSFFVVKLTQRCCSRCYDSRAPPVHC